MKRRQFLKMVGVGISASAWTDSGLLDRMVEEKKAKQFRCNMIPDGHLFLFCDDSQFPEYSDALELLWQQNRHKSAVVTTIHKNGLDVKFV